MYNGMNCSNNKDSDGAHQRKCHKHLDVVANHEGILLSAVALHCAQIHN